ncbi:MAG: hypothetical protein JWN77_1972 [Frankiales bacterium]|nr:hypothetical protein [Frankiales bacterium]
MSAAAVPLDRRGRRRLETIEEVLDIAAAIMREQGVAGLAIGEIARRMGIRPPSLYVYFPSKNALYDALFARGARLVLARMEQVNAELADEQDADLQQHLVGAARGMVGWALEQPEYAQLLFWRPVPGFEPSPDAYEPAVRLVETGTGWLTGLRDRGLLRPDVSVADALRDWTVLTSGIVSQQLSNEPGGTLDAGRFTAAIPSLVAMFTAQYGAPAPTATPAPRPRRTRRADPR